MVNSFSPHLCSNSDRQYVEVDITCTFLADANCYTIMQKVNKNDHGPTKGCQEAVDLIASRKVDTILR